MKSGCLVVCCCAVLICASVVADPSLRGYTGLIEMPTADALDRGQYNLGFNVTEVEDFDSPHYLANYGMGDDLEVGVLWLHPEHGSNETLINLKHQFRSGRDGRPSFAFGVADITDERDTSVYAVGTWEIDRPLGGRSSRLDSTMRVHAGIGGGGIDDFFFGVDMDMGDRLRLMGEHINDDFNVGARARLWRNVSAQASLLDMQDLAVGISWNKPLGRSRTLEPVIEEEETASKPEGAPTAMVPRVGSSRTTTGSVAVAPPPAEPDVSDEVAATTRDEPDAVEPAPPTMVTVDVTSAAADAPVAEPADDPAPADDSTGDTVAAVTDAAIVVDEPVVASGDAETAETPDPFALHMAVDGSKPMVAIASDACPAVKGDHVLVPLRAVAQWLGYRVDAEATDRGIFATVFAGSDAVRFLIGDDRAEVDGARIDLPAPTCYQDQRTAMVPAEFFRLLGVPVEADPEAGTALFERHDAVGVVACSK